MVQNKLEVAIVRFPSWEVSAAWSASGVNLSVYLAVWRHAEYLPLLPSVSSRSTRHQPVSTAPMIMVWQVDFKRLTFKCTRIHKASPRDTTPVTWRALGAYVASTSRKGAVFFLDR
jgi:hypothetical protein